MLRKGALLGLMACGASLRAWDDGTKMSHVAGRSHSHRLHVTDFGAVGDNRTDVTAAFEEAVAASAGLSGHTTILVAPGTYRLFPISLASRMTLHLAAGATLLGMPFGSSTAAWPLISALPRWSRGRGDTITVKGTGQSAKLPRNESKALLHGANLDDVSIRGEGRTSVIEMHGWDWSSRPGWSGSHPSLMRFVRSTNVRVLNVQLRNSPYWTCHFWECDRVHVSRVSIIAPLDSVNTDGWDPDSSSNVLIEESSYEGGDDCVSVKSGWDCFGIENGQPSTNITVRGLTCKGPRAGIAIGSEVSGGVHNVSVEHVHFVDTGCMVHLKTGHTRGGAVSNIRFSKLTAVGTLGDGIVINTGFRSNSRCPKGWMPPAMTRMSDIKFVHIDASNATITGYSFDFGAKHANPPEFYFSKMELRLEDVHLPRGRRGAWRCGVVTKLSTTHVTPKHACYE